MGKKDKNYYSPTEYEKYRNASKIKNGSERSEKSYTIHDDEYFYSQLQAENNRHQQRKNGENTTPPKPPANVKPKEVKRASVYDEIAARHKRERGAINSGELTPLKPITPVVPEKLNIAEEKKSYEPVSSASVEKKIFNQSPVTEEETEMFISKITQMADYDAEDRQYFTQADIEEICMYYKKKYSRKMWIVLIISLITFCGLIVGMYLYTGGYLDNLLNNLIS